MKNLSAIRKMLSLLLFVSLLACSASARGPEEDYTIRFAIIGDRTGGAQPGIYGGILAEIERMKPDFVMTVGDMIEGPARDTTETIERWEEYISLISCLSMPIWFTPGNNDIWDSSSETMYTRYIGEPYFSFDFSYLHFVILDNSRWESSDELPREQLNWLIHDLETEREDAKTLVFIHKPFWNETTAQGKPDTLHRLFHKFGVDAVFTGHYHVYFTGTYDDILYTSVGSSGGYCQPGPTGLMYHFLWVTIDRNRISMAPIKMGAVLPWDEVKATDRLTIRRLTESIVDFPAPLLVGDDIVVSAQELAVIFSNADAEHALEDTARWDVPDGWSVKPATMPVSLGPDETITLSYAVRSEGPLYPVPILSLDVPYREGRAFSLERYLPIARTARCSKTDASPTIDGAVDDGCWNHPVSRLYAPDGQIAHTDSTCFYFSHDDSTLYLAVYCKEAEIDSMTANVVDRDGPIYGEDCVGYFLQPDTSSSVIYQIYFNPLGAVFDRRITLDAQGGFDADVGWNGEYDVETLRGQGFWSIEVAIPLDTFGAITSDEQWRINFRRKQKRLNTSADWQIPIAYNPEGLGYLRME